MILREAIQQFKGFRYMTEQLEICSAPGRRFLLESAWLKTEEEVEQQLAKVAEVLELLETAPAKRLIGNISCKLMQLRDIHATVKHAGEERVMDDLELYELKNFALLSEDIRGLVEGWKCVKVPVLQEVVELLDPEAERIPHFYIYDAYSVELALLRKELKQKKQEGAEEAETEKLYFRSVEIEDTIREELSQRLTPYREKLENALQQLALLDVLIAKAKLAKDMALVRPRLVDGQMVFRGLFNPPLQAVLEKSGKCYQPVDLTLRQEATLITGANMVGKTVLLKTVALAQCMLQFGFYVPAREAAMIVTDMVMDSIGDEQDEMNGLSSFAAEMLRINQMVEQIRKGSRVLVLIDELARTTNPVEGQAIVNGVVDFLSAHQVMALVTTHYSGIIAAACRLRVRGFVEEKIQGEVTLENINRWIDYSLEEEQDNEVPREALRIAGLLGIDNELLTKAKTFLDEKGKN